MKYMKTVVASVLIYLALFLLVLVVAQVFTGYDFTGHMRRSACPASPNWR